MYQNLAEVYKYAYENYGTKSSFWTKNETKEFVPFTYKELYETGRQLAAALIDLGVGAREHVGVLADNRLEWIIVDCGVILAGAANVPRGSDITDSEIDHILNHSEVKVLFLENDKLYERYSKLRSKTPKVKTIVIMDRKSTLTGDGIYTLNGLIEKGKTINQSKVDERIAGIKPDDLFTLIYTSGTTGLPKGVMLKHSNMVHQLRVLATSIIPVTTADRGLSILPVWHIFERVNEYLFIATGGNVYYTKVADMRNDLAKVKPTFMASAPRVWESIYNGIYTRVNDPKQTPAIRKFLFNAAYFYSHHFKAAKRFLVGNEVDYEGRNIFESLFRGITSIFKLIFTTPAFSILCFYLGFAIQINEITPLDNLWAHNVLYFLGALGIFFNAYTLDAIVLAKIRTATGGALRATVSGGGALQKHVDEFFNDIGIVVLEGYGMTETSPVLAVRSFKKRVLGSVGPVVGETEIQIRDDHGNVLTHVDVNGKITGKRGKKGVIFARGPQVMKGYYRNEEATAKVLVDGWMNTGDLGMINFNDTLTLTGRAKDTVVLLGGENVEPVPIENKMDESPFIHQSMVVGQDQKVLGAIIVPDFTKLAEWCKENGISETKPEQLIENPKVIEFYKKEVRRLNSTKTGFKSFEQVQPVALILKQFEVGDELTNLLKMKRHVITAKYEAKIKDMFKSY